MAVVITVRIMGSFCRNLIALLSDRMGLVGKRFPDFFFSAKILATPEEKVEKRK